MTSWNLTSDTDSETASFNEKLLLSNGLCVSPLKGRDGFDTPKSLRDVVYGIDNVRDLNNYISSFSSKVNPKGAARYPASCLTKPAFLSC